MNRDDLKNALLRRDNDPMGAAIYDYYKTGRAGKLRVLSSQFDEDEIPVRDLFRKFGDMSKLEQMALNMSEGEILDVGAGSGCHSLELQKMGKSVLAIDISPLSVEVMRERGLNARQVNLYDDALAERFDTILFLMNGSGIIGTLDNMHKFFARMKQLLAPGGAILMDSSDLSYLYEDEDGSFEVDLAGEYYGQVDFRMKYRGITGDLFDWLYVDFDTLSYYAKQNGFEAELVAEGAHYDYLARITMK